MNIAGCTGPKLSSWFLLIVIVIAWGLAARAMEPPPPGMLEQMQRDGIYDQAQAFAQRLGNHKPRTPLRGAALQTDDPAELARQIGEHMGQSLDAKGAKAVSAASQQELSWVQLDLNHDRVVDERDLLVLGYPRPKETAAFPSMGTVNTFCLLLDFADYPSFFPKAEFEQNLFGAGTPDYYYRGLTEYYKEASYNQLHIAGEVYGWHRASQPRTYYHPDDDIDTGTQSARQTELVEEAILAADAAGADFSQYDNDGDGAVDYFLCVWSGPHGAWSTFWWGYFGVSLPDDFVVDGVRFSSYSWQWEQYYGFGDTPPNPQHWDPLVTIHETGHALGLPDYYDYDGNQGPDGGLGGLDMMDANRGDHNPFSKYYFGWISPVIAFGNLDNQQLRAAASFPDAVIAMPGYDPVTPYAEYYIAQNRFRTGLDSVYPNDGILVWHVDSRLSSAGAYQYDNSYTAHKFLQLVQADGLGEIEAGSDGADAGDYYNAGESLAPASTPNSNRYDGSATNITMNDISADSADMTADFTLYSTNPPQVQITAPNGGDTITGSSTVTVTATDDVSVSKLQLFIDGELVASAAASSLNYTWNSLVDFNKPLNIMARAWDGEGQSGTAVTGVTVDNVGVTGFADTFDSAPAPLVNWRVQNYPLSERGQLTFWSSRVSPANPPRTGAGNEAYCRIPVGGSNTTTYPCNDGLRAQRIDSSAFTRPVQLEFQYRNRGGLSLWATTDEGATWQRLENLPVTNSWAQYNKLLNLSGPSIYLRFLYEGSVRNNTNSSQSGNIADFSVREAPSDPPTVIFTSPANAAVLSGSMSFDVEPTDDGTIDRVVFSILGTEVFTDADGAPWNYTRDTSADDNDPALLVRAVAYDDDGIPSAPAEITVALRNPKVWPARDDFEAGSNDWVAINDGRRPEWGDAPGEGRGGSAALGYFTATTWQNNNNDGVLFMGEPVPSGLQSIDLSDPLVTAPVATYWYKGQLANNWGLSLYFYNTWRGYQYITDHATGAADWEQRSASLAAFTGQSGRLVLWIFGGNSTTNGTAAYIDDVSVDNAAPVLDTIFPNTGFPGETLTLTGSNFGLAQGASTVTFTGASPAPTDYISWSDTSIQLRVPDTAQSGPVFVSVGVQDSNTQGFTVAPLALSFTGLDPAQVYTAADMPALTVTASPVFYRVELWVDGVRIDESNAAPAFADLAVTVARIKNGHHDAGLKGFTPNGMLSSALAPLIAYSLPGDLNGDGVINNGDAAALPPLLGLLRGGPGYEFWYDPDDDGIVTEADMSYIGYHFGEQLGP